MKLQTSFLLLTLYLIAGQAFGQINYFKMYGETEFDQGNSIVQLEDSSYVIAGTSGSFDQGNTQAFLLRIDSLGNFMWSRDYGGYENESFEKVLYDPVTGFVAVGYSNSYSTGDYDLYISKIDINGTEEWAKTYGTDNWERAIDVSYTSDGGLMIVGEISVSGTGKDIWVLRTDQNGDSLWSKEIDFSGDDIVTSIDVFQDSLYLISGSVYVQDSTASKGYLHYMDEQGVVLWDTIMGGDSGDYIINDFCIKNDTVYSLATHYTDVDSIAHRRYYLFEINTDSLTLFHEYQFYTNEHTTGDLITNYGSGNDIYISYGITAYWTSPGANDLFWGRLYHVTNNVQTVGSLVHPNEDRGTEFIPTSDGGAMMVGYTRSGGMGGSTIFVVKIGPNEAYPTVQGVTMVTQLVSTNTIEEIGIVEVYPNPTSDQITIQLIESGQCDIELIDGTGKKIVEQTIYNSGVIDATLLSAGTYSIIIRDDSGRAEVHRLIVK